MKQLAAVNKFSLYVVENYAQMVVIAGISLGQKVVLHIGALPHTRNPMLLGYNLVGKNNRTKNRIRKKIVFHLFLFKQLVRC
ncbi:hypothetical protein EI752_12430 [Salmonella enterica]|nr:hypothetical protein [Salmonella enterica]